MRRLVPCNALTIRAEPIDATAFAPFGDVVVQPRGSKRTDWSGALATPREDAAISFSTANVAMTRFPLSLTKMERHPHSFQTFVPLDVSGYLVCVAPNGADGLPAVDLLRAYIVPAGIGITYRAKAWHCPMMALDRPGQFAILMWMSGDGSDDEFVDLGNPLTVQGA